MSQEEAIVALLQQQARMGTRPHELLHLLHRHIAPKWAGHIPLVSMEKSLMHAFGIPLPDVRCIEMWCRWGPGDATDDDIDRLLSPWIERYLQQHP